MNSIVWRRRAWIITVLFVLVFVVNPELRALVFLIDVLSLEVFLLFAGLQVKSIWLVVQPALVIMLKPLARHAATFLRQLDVAVNALNPRVSFGLLVQQGFLAAHFWFRDRLANIRSA